MNAIVEIIVGFALLAIGLSLIPLAMHLAITGIAQMAGSLWYLPQIMTDPLPKEDDDGTDD